jgi:hypothetical protein
MDLFRSLQICFQFGLLRSPGFFGCSDLFGSYCLVPSNYADFRASFTESAGAVWAQARASMPRHASHEIALIGPLDAKP